MKKDLHEKGMRRMPIKPGCKVFVSVGATFSKDGILRPAWLEWEDGTRYKIERIKHCERAASLKAGGIGYRYTCLICGQEHYLYYDDADSKWFVERK
jgi:hypothetical protein